MKYREKPVVIDGLKFWGIKGGAAIYTGLKSNQFEMSPEMVLLRDMERYQTRHLDNRFEKASHEILEEALRQKIIVEQKNGPKVVLAANHKFRLILHDQD